jgi:molecular chaperone DnaK (HSP70)
MRTEKKPAVGLDFGTTTTLVASGKGVVPIGDSEPWMPSLVGFGEEGTIVAGEAALEVAEDQVVRSIKRSITERRDFVRVDTPTGIRDVRADDLIVEVLREAARRGTARGQAMTAGAMTGKNVLRLGCPGMWDGRQRRRLVELARRADLPVNLASLVDEPVAAGIAWLSGREVEAAAALRVLVFDMGGGTLDIAVLDVRGVNHHDVSVLAALGVPEAGDALDEAIAEDLDFALGAAGVDIDSLSHPLRARERLRDAAREAKVGLSSAPEYAIVLPLRLFGTAELVYTRDQLDAVFAPQMDRAEQYVAAALRAARLTELVSGAAYDIARTPLDSLVAGVDVVVLSGGMCQIPYVTRRMAELFPPGTRIEMASSPSENAVAVGLAKAGQYGRINMYRPAFDVLLEWAGGSDFRTLYEAFTPLVEAWQIVQGGSDLRFTRNGLDLSLPRKARNGRLRVVSHSGQQVRASLGGQSLEGFPVALSEQKFEFSIYPNGRLRLTDSSGTHEGQVEDWYAMHGHDHGDRLASVASPLLPEEPVHYPFDRDRN